MHNKEIQVECVLVKKLYILLFSEHKSALGYTFHSRFLPSKLNFFNFEGSDGERNCVLFLRSIN